MVQTQPALPFQMNKRVNMRAILADPKLRRQLMVPTIIAIQAREGIETTQAQAEAAYDKVEREQRKRHSSHLG